MENNKPKTMQDLKNSKLYTIPNTIGFLSLILTIPLSVVAWIWFDFWIAFKIGATGVILFISTLIITNLLKESFLKIIESQKYTENPETGKSNFQKKLEEAARKRQGY